MLQEDVTVAGAATAAACVVTMATAVMFTVAALLR